MRAIVDRLEVAHAEEEVAMQDYADWLAGRVGGQPSPARTIPEDEVLGLQVAARTLASVWADHPDYDKDWTV